MEAPLLLLRYHPAEFPVHANKSNEKQHKTLKGCQENEVAELSYFVNCAIGSFADYVPSVKVPR